MKRKYQNLPQVEINIIVVDRLLNEVQSWDEESIEDLIYGYNEVFEKPITHIEQLKETVKIVDPDLFADHMDDILDDAGDAFGTERQCDPRGDFRNGQWNMWEIE